MASKKQYDPLPSWNDGDNKLSIISFVQDVIDEKGPHFVPHNQRIAAFDFDGTLVGGGCGGGKHPHYIGKAYLPMRELISYLHDNGFVCWIVSGSCEYRQVKHFITKYDIPVDCLIGSVGFESKATSIEKMSGFRPILAAGDGGNDYAMLCLSEDQPDKTLQLVICHDDAHRELDYSGSEFVQRAKRKGWNIVSMKNDWKTIFWEHDSDAYLQALSSFDEEIGLLRRRMEIPQVSLQELPVIDGKLNEDVYRNHSWSEPFIGFIRLGDPVVIEGETRVFGAYDSSNLYIAFRCDEPNMGAQKYDADAVWSGETIEIAILKPGQPVDDPKAEFYHFMLTPNNDRRESLDIGESALYHKYDPEWVTATSKETDHWIAEIAIPFREIGITDPRPGLEIAINFARTRSSDQKEQSSWSQYGAGFQEPDHLGVWFLQG